jgi:hypothetical protein
MKPMRSMGPMKQVRPTSTTRTTRRRAARGFLILGGLAACTAAAALGVGARDDSRIDAGSGGAATRTSALAAFDTIQAVLQHPRCQNCHIPGDAPLQFDSGIVHMQNIQRGPDGNGAPGLPCSTCHGVSNPPASYGAHVPPGAPNWHLPPPQRKMVFIGLAKPELCATIKDPKRNGGKDLAALLEHVSHDKLVLWGWDPGVGRAPVAVPHAAFVASFKTWIAGGAPCPETAAPARAAGRR